MQSDISVYRYTVFLCSVINAPMLLFTLQIENYETNASVSVFSNSKKAA